MKDELRQYLEDYGVRQTWVAEKLGVSRQMVSYYIKGERGFSPKNEIKLRELLDKINNRAI